jgi:hypothetical protein
MCLFPFGQVFLFLFPGSRETANDFGEFVNLTSAYKHRLRTIDAIHQIPHRQPLDAPTATT